MRKEIKQFLKKHNQPILELEHEGKSNTLHEWYKIQNPFRTMYNGLIIKFCKILPIRLKILFYRHLLGIKIGKNVGIAPDTEIDYFYPQLISIGDNSMLGWKLNLLCHEFARHKVKLGRINIGKNVLIGAFSTIRLGVTIGENSVVGMNSFVNKDIPPNELWGGVPAKRIKKLKR